MFGLGLAVSASMYGTPPEACQEGQMTTNTQQAQAQKNKSYDKQIADVTGPVKSIKEGSGDFASVTYVFNEQGKIIQMDGAAVTAANSKRDKFGRLTKVTLPSVDDLGDPMDVVITYTYNQASQLASKHVADVFGEYTIKYTRDKANKLTGHNVHAVGTINKVTYKYVKFDAHNNWIEIVTTDSYGNKEAWIRTITYY